jgi:hypothetical protein
MEKYSKNKKLNEVLKTIESQLLELGLDEIKHYKDNFKDEIDFNIAQYGNLLIYYVDVKEMYRNCGYKTLDKMSDEKVWEIYKRQVGYVASQLVK